MSFFSDIFGGGDRPPAPAPVPVAPTSDPLAEQKRLDAERAAIADQKARGRQSTIVGGMSIADEEQQGRGLLAAKRREAARMLGD